MPLFLYLRSVPFAFKCCLVVLRHPIIKSIIALLAARGGGKSAALGLVVDGAIVAGYSNIFITTPNPNNLKTLFEFVIKGFDTLEYKEHMDYDVVKSSNPDFKKATIRINIYKQHRQTIQEFEQNGVKMMQNGKNYNNQSQAQVKEAQEEINRTRFINSFWINLYETHQRKQRKK